MSYKLLINYQLLINTRQYVRLGGNVLFSYGSEGSQLERSPCPFLSRANRVDIGAMLCTDLLRRCYIGFAY